MPTEGTYLEREAVHGCFVKRLDFLTAHVVAEAAKERHLDLYSRSDLLLQAEQHFGDNAFGQSTEADLVADRDRRLRSPPTFFVIFGGVVSTQELSPSDGMGIAVRIAPGVAIAGACSDCAGTQSLISNKSGLAEELLHGHVAAPPNAGRDPGRDVSSLSSRGVGSR